MLAILTLLVALLPGGGERPPDTLELAGGAKLSGRVVYEDAEEVVLRIGSNERSVPRAKITRLESRFARLRTLLERWRALEERDLEGTLALAKECRAGTFEEEAQLFAWYVLACAPKHAAAHEFLGHEKRGEGWIAPDGTRRWPYEKLLELRRDWKNAWEFESEHYRVRTNLPLHDALVAVLELEGAYEAFFELLGRPLRFRELVEPLSAQVHADRKSFPEMAGDARSYFDHGSRVLLVNASEVFERGAVVHEATHQLLDACIQSTRSGRGDVPGWLNEGLAEFLRSTTGGPPGRSIAFPEAFDEARFREHAQARDPYDLSRVLNFGSDDFFGSVKSSLKYSQSYTLVCWGLLGEERKLRPRFFDYLREACKGHSSSTAFKDTLKLDDAAIEKSWIAYVRSRAGTK